MADTHKTGGDCKVYRNTNTNASPTLVEVPEFKDVTLSIQIDQADISDRQSGYKKFWDAQKEVTLSGAITYRQGNSNFDALRAAALAGTAIQFYILDGDSTTSGNQGLKVYMKIFGFDSNQPLSEGVTYDLELKPTYFEESSAVIEPAWHTVA